MVAQNITHVTKQAYIHHGLHFSSIQISSKSNILKNNNNNI